MADSDPWQDPRIPAFQKEIGHGHKHCVRSGGPERIYDSDEADPNFKPKPFIGFTTHLKNKEPLIWDGDQA